ncbi:Rpr2-domain-containing protein [Coemansia reversa NRRL 1564]|uniref:Rpr2-domain-containing protein n=1 Tax=Coemansia reversa (strain ATCC 12441 / NRRL 1564) TaxID=763665 RepID=A0A2G5BL87_COERN|nr:Rpr2-domain-containing protein [Coemansia reversa NRRL 1564]|eukprot:PIA19766.1 Rpr2-domain-containing protein [Coemansia reversa NRRL 1564]
MGKGRRGQKSGSLPNRELYERMNFLYQSSQFFATHCQSIHSVESTEKLCSESPPLSSSVAAEAVVSSNIASDMHSISTPLLPLARFYTKEMRQMARKSVLRVSPHVKREICKICSTPLMPGVSCTIRIKGKAHGKRVITTCTYCGSQKRLMANSDHTLFVDKPDHGTIH